MAVTLKRYKSLSFQIYFKKNCTLYIASMSFQIWFIFFIQFNWMMVTVNVLVLLFVFYLIMLNSFSGILYEISDQNFKIWRLLSLLSIFQCFCVAWNTIVLWISEIKFVLKLYSLRNEIKTYYHSNEENGKKIK